MSQKRTTRDILNDAERILNTAKFGLADFTKGNPERKIAGLMNVATFGRAITNVLQNLRHIESKFDVWYSKYVDEMKNDELMKYFYELRSTILKEGQVKVATNAFIENFKYPQDMAKFGRPPPNARGFFIGDQYGGTGWEVAMQDGTIAKYYVNLPEEIGRTWLSFPNPPTHHLGKEIKNLSAEEMSKLYIDYLSRMLESAKKTFSTEI